MSRRREEVLELSMSERLTVSCDRPWRRGFEKVVTVRATSMAKARKECFKHRPRAKNVVVISEKMIRNEFDNRAQAEWKYERTR